MTPKKSPVLKAHHCVYNDGNCICKCFVEGMKAGNLPNECPKCWKEANHIVQEDEMVKLLNEFSDMGFPGDKDKTLIQRGQCHTILSYIRQLQDENKHLRATKERLETIIVGELEEKNKLKAEIDTLRNPLCHCGKKVTNEYGTCSQKCS